MPRVSANAERQALAKQSHQALLAYGVREDFGSLMAQYCRQRGYSNQRLAWEVGVDPSYFLRCRNGDRQPPSASIIAGIGRVLGLTHREIGRLMLAGGYAPPTLIAYGVWDDTLETIVGALADPLLEPDERDELATILRTVAGRYQQMAKLRAQSERTVSVTKNGVH